MTWGVDTLRLVNAKVNLLTYETQIGDDWNPYTKNGFDCNNYATRKQEELYSRGVPKESMRLACCFVEPFRLQDKITGEWRDATKRERYHAVLLVDVNGTTYVMDNRHPYPTEYDLLPYEWHKLWSHVLNDWEWAVDADRSFA